MNQVIAIILITTIGYYRQCGRTIAYTRVTGADCR